MFFFVLVPLVAFCLSFSLSFSMYISPCCASRIANGDEVLSDFLLSSLLFLGFMLFGRGHTFVMSLSVFLVSTEGGSRRPFGQPGS